MYVDWTGWCALFGGSWGAIGVATAKTFHKGDFVNADSFMSEEEKRTEITVTPRERWMIVLVCSSLAVYGAMRIQSKHNWNPFNATEPSLVTNP